MGALPDDTSRITSPVPVLVAVTALVAVVAGGAVVVRLVGAGRGAAPAGARPLRHYLRLHPRARAFLTRRLDAREATGLLLTVTLAVLVGAGVAFGLVLEMVTSQRGLYRFDAGAAEWGAEHATPGTTDVLVALTQLGSTAVTVAVAAAVAAEAWVRRREARVAVFLAAVLVGQNLLANGIKLAVDRDRPAVHPLVEATGLSFPSGHATAAAATATAVAFVLARRRGRAAKLALGLAAAAVTVVVAATRVLLGVHWLTDVVAGTFLGLGWFAACAVAFGGRLLRFGAPVASAGGETPLSRGP